MNKCSLLIGFLTLISLQLADFEVFSQVLPLEINRNYTAKHIQFGSGVKFEFNDRTNEGNEAIIEKLFKKAEKHFANKDYRKSKDLFHKIILIDYPEEAETYNNFGGVRELKFRSCEYLSIIYYEEKNYTKSLLYDKMANEKFAVLFLRCGSRSCEEQLYKPVYYSVCYENVGKIEQAIEVLMPFVISCYSSDDKCTYKVRNDVVERVVLLLNQKYDKRQLRNEMAKAILNLYSEEIFYYIKFLDYKISLSGIVLFNQKIPAGEMKTFLQNELMNHLFYKLIMEN